MALNTRVYANVSAMQNADRMNGERIRRIIEAKSVPDAMKMLGEMGYNYTDAGIDGFIVAETNEFIDFISDTAASEKLASALTARFKYNNCKLAYKSRFITVPNDGYYRTELDCEKIAAGDYDGTDKYMREALERLDAAGESKPQNIDKELTRAMYAFVCSCGIPIVKKYFRTEIDLKNILSAARMKRLGLSGDEFIAGGKLPISRLEECVAADEGFAEFFENTPYEEYAENIEGYGADSLWKAERDADDYLIYLTDKDVAEFSSFEPFLDCYTKTLVELKTVKTALVCVKNDARDGFFERAAKIYLR